MSPAALPVAARGRSGWSGAGLGWPPEGCDRAGEARWPTVPGLSAADSRPGAVRVGSPEHAEAD
jgi:hypothetical protein